MDFDPSPYIAETKKRLKARQDVEKSLGQITQAFERELETLGEEIAQGKSGIPEIQYADIAAGKVTTAQVDELKRKGCVIIRNVFDRKRAEGWNTVIGEYVEQNAYFTTAGEKAGLV